MVEKKTIKNNISSERKSKTKNYKLSGGASVSTGKKETNGKFTIKYDEIIDTRLNLKKPVEQNELTEKVKSYQDLEYIKTFLSHKIKYLSPESELEPKQSVLKGGANRNEIESGNLFFISEVIIENIENAAKLNYEYHHNNSVNFEFKDKIKKEIGSVKDFMQKYAVCITTLFNKELMKKINDGIIKFDESEIKDYLPELKGIYDEIIKAFNDFNTKLIENSTDQTFIEIYEKITEGLRLENEKAQLDDNQLKTLIKFFMGMFLSTVIGLKTSPKISKITKDITSIKLQSIFNEGQNLKGGSNFLNEAKNMITDNRIKQYTTYLDKRLGLPDTESYGEYDNNNKIHDLEIYKYLYNFLIHDGTFFDLVPRKQINRISIFFSDNFTVLRRHFLFHLCAFSRERYDVLMTFFKSKENRMQLEKFNPLGNKNSRKNFNKQLEIYTSKKEPEFNNNNITNEYIESCFDLFFLDTKNNDDIGKELGMYSLFYQGEIDKNFDTFKRIFTSMTTSKSANIHYNSFTETSPIKFLNKLGGDNKFRIKEYFFYNDIDEKKNKNLKIAINANISVSETKIFTFNLEEFRDVGGIREGLFKVLDNNSEPISFKLGILNVNKRKKFFYEVNEIVNRYRFFRCSVWMGIKVSTIAATHAAMAASSVASMASAETVVAGEVGSAIGIDPTVATGVATEVGTGVATEGETVAQGAMYLTGDETGSIVLGVLGVLATIGEMGRFSSSGGTGSSEASGGGIFSNSKYKELLYTADNELFKSESSGLLKQKNIKNIYNLYLELKNFDVTYCNDNDCGKIGKVTKGVVALGIKLSNNMTDIPCLYFTKLRLNYVRRKNEDINKEIEETLSIKEFKDEPKPEPEPKSNNVNTLMLAGDLVDAAGDAMWWSFIGEGMAALLSS